MTGLRLTEYQKGQIDSLRLARKKASDIAKIINKSKSCVSRYFRAVPAGETRHERYSPRRPRKITDHGCRVITRAFQKSPRKSCKKLKNEYPELFKDVKVRTLQDYSCRVLGYRSRCARKKPLLTKAH